MDGNLGTDVHEQKESSMFESGMTNTESSVVFRDLMFPAATSTATQGRPFAWLPMIAVSLCMVVQTVAISSLATYVGIYTQGVLNLPSLDMSGESERAGGFVVM